MDREALGDKFRNVFAFIPTPFMPDNYLELNEKGYTRNVRFLIDNGVRAGVVCAGTGEISSLSVEEIKRASKAAIEEASGDCLLVPSLPPNIKQALDVGTYVEKIGAEAVLVFPPRASEEAIVSYHEQLSDHLSVGFMLYPQGAQTWSLKLYEDLAKIENVIALKDEISSVEKFEEIARLIGDSVVCISKKDHSTRVMQFYYMVGAQGFCGGTISIVPKYELGIHEAGIRKDWGKMRELQKQLLPLCLLRARTDGVGLLKAGLDLQGLAGGPVRPPRRDLTSEERQELKVLLEKLGARIIPS
ncbi:MAG: dihydrodipicolinate synthase family protein [Candidatus Bathyarchaeota archaeon]|nr:dihydrodipicolinate synthase family protein [Candidatus Bathyarchaeota archaeon]MDH5688250.1 dihydrodipicolinate synthase family protein [Candidatus Bathyarchaeota archaeon]